MPKIPISAVSKLLGKTQRYLKPIGTAFGKLSTGRKAALIGGGAGLTGLGYTAGSTGGGDTTINKVSSDEKTIEFVLEKIAARKKTHPVSERQRKWAFAAEERGELPKGKAHAWSKRVEGENLPEKTSADEIAEAAFMDELQKIATKKGLKKLVKGIAKKHPEVINEVSSNE